MAIGVLGAVNGRVKFPGSPAILSNLLEAVRDGDAVVYQQLFGGSVDPVFRDVTADSVIADVVTVNQTLSYGSLLTEGLTTGITAFATGGQADATALTTTINNVTVCVTAGDSVKLPPAAAGLAVVVKNSGATGLDIFPASGDSIDALAVNLAIRINPGSVVVFMAISATVWESDVDASLTLVAPTTNTGSLQLLAAASAGNTVTTITNASQAAARTYTIPDAGGNASFLMSEGAQTVNGAKTFGDQIIGDSGGSAAAPSFGALADMGMYPSSGTELAWSTEGVFRGRISSAGLEIASPGINNSVIGADTPQDGTFETLQANENVTLNAAASTEGVGVMRLRYASGSVTCAGGGTETITLNIPTGAKLHAAWLRNDDELTATTGVSYTAAFNGGSAITIDTGVAFAKNTKVTELMDENAASLILTNTTNIVLTPNAGTLDTGTVSAIVAYWQLTAMTDAA